MKYLYFLSFLIGLVACANKSPKNEVVQAIPTESQYSWTKLLDSAAWRKNYNFQMFSMRDTLYVLHPDGTWYSTDGKKWQKNQLSNIIHNHAFLDYVQFKDAVYGLGHFSGNIETFTFKPEIYKTSDLKTWVTIAKNCNLPDRFFYHPFVFDDKIWIIGGEDKNNQYADIWNSEDGIHWVKQKERSSFGQRSGSLIVPLHNKLYLLNNDVWSSDDALNWEKVTDEIVPGEQIFGYAALVFDGKIWLLGCNRNGQFSSEVLYSQDGKTWESMSAPWLPRGGIAASVHQDKIYMTGGKYGGTPNHPDFRYDNDVWVLGKK